MPKYQEMLIIQQETHYIICAIKKVINLLAQIYQEKQTHIFLNKLISLKNWQKIMVQQYFYYCEEAKNYFKLFFRFIKRNIIV